MKLHTFKGEFPIEIEIQKKKKLYRMKKVKVDKTLKSNSARHLTF